MGNRWSDEDLDAFHREFTEQVAKGQELFKELANKSDMNTATIDRIEVNTRGLLEAWNEGQAVVRAGAVLGRFGRWLVGLAVFGAFFRWLLTQAS